MSTPTRVAAFVAGLAAVFGVAFAVGASAGPLDATPQEPAAHAGMTAEPEHGGSMGGGHDDGVPGGLMVSRHGYTLALDHTTLPAGPARPVSFVVRGPEGRPLTTYDVEHAKRLHLVAVRRDFSGFQHVHPVLGADGRWRTNLDLTPGPWRVFADFTPSGADGLTLGADLTVPGRYRPAGDGTTSTTSRVDGYTVTMRGRLTAGEHTMLGFDVTRDGAPVTDLQPYLGAYGHLVALRAGDLAYLHVHPDDAKPEPGPRIGFGAEVPSAGTYHLYLDFKHHGVVRTATFTVRAR
ncbi:MAG: hypothetical protein HOQ22_06290 [Nocardioidaceae bacterium]|nr:hypothetical protein [Nocardioidaceae bacterium]NUS50639.1 hypothetical protein [Nocardioidaceae bacterium]